jgi:RNA polymerase sigma factor (sigma-70 family)
MDAQPATTWAMTDTDRSTAEAFRRERARLGQFIKRRVPDAADAEDILQEVFFELVETARLLEPVEQVGAWLFRVARNRITDLFRKKQHRVSMSSTGLNDGDVENADDPSIDDLLPSEQSGPEAQYARRILLEALEEALNELPPEQREVFVAHELDGLSFKQLAVQSGTPINTLLSRKRYAVLHLRTRLQDIRDDFLD